MIALLCLAIVIASANAECEMRKINADCKDTRRDILDAYTMDDCRKRCDADNHCKGYVWKENEVKESTRCNLWYGTECDQEIEAKYFEKVCDGVRTAAEMESKNALLDLAEDNAWGGYDGGMRACSPIDMPIDTLSDLTNTNVGAEVTFYCANNHLQGSRSIRCREDQTWTDVAPHCVPLE